MEIKVIKIGGNVVDHPDKLDAFLKDFARIEGLKVLVHGGGKIATTLSKTLGIETQMIDGRRVTDGETIRVVTMVYAGLINKTITAHLQAFGCNAWGVCGADGNLLPARRRSPHPIDYGFVGDPIVESFGIRNMQLLLDNGFVPVVAPITHDTTGDLLNTNADTVAQSVAVGLSACYPTDLIYCLEKPGVLTDVEDPTSVIPSINRSTYQALKQQGVIFEGMIPKLDNAFKAIDNGIRSVVICGSDALLTPGYGGTTLTDMN